MSIGQMFFDRKKGSQRNMLKFELAGEQILEKDDNCKRLYSRDIFVNIADVTDFFFFLNYFFLR